MYIMYGNVKKNKYNDCNEMQWYGTYLVARTRRRSEHQGHSLPRGCLSSEREPFI